MSDEQGFKFTIFVLLVMWITFYLDKICGLLEKLIEMIG